MALRHQFEVLRADVVEAGCTVDAEDLVRGSLEGYLCFAEEDAGGAEHGVASMVLLCCSV